MCYICANEHFDKGHQVDWGFDIFEQLEEPKSEINEQMNAGY